MMSEAESLLRAYERFASLPWERNLATAQRVWFAIYDPAQERRIRLRMSEFEIATKKAGHGWRHLDISDSFAQWMAGHKYREAYFEDPDLMELALDDFAQHVSQLLIQALTDSSVDENTVVAILGIGSLYGLTRASAVLDRATSAIRGRLLVFFPGHSEDGNYRLLDARDGWNYLAVPITGKDGD